MPSTNESKREPKISDGVGDLVLLTIKQVSKLVGMSATSIRERIREGTFPKANVVEGMRFTRWTTGAIQTYLQQRVSQPEKSGLQEKLTQRAKGANFARKHSKGERA